MALELRQVEIRSAASRDKLPGVVEEVEREVENTAGNRRPVDADVLLRQMPSTRPHEKRCDLLLKLVRLALGTYVVDPAANGVTKVNVPLDVVVPLRRVRVFEVGHENARPRIERVDDHLAVDRPRDLDPAILNVGWDR